jgi:septal ring factor EnvC (AmiA/AmiB activator)
MISSSNSLRTDSVRSTGSSLRDPNILAVLNMEQQIQNLDGQISPLRKTQKKLDKLEKELARINLLIDSDLGTNSDKKHLRKTKSELRQQRIKLWGVLEKLPALEEERHKLAHQLDVFQRRHGLL